MLNNLNFMDSVLFLFMLLNIARYIALAIFKSRKKNKTVAVSPFSQYRDIEITQQRYNGGAKNCRCDLGYTFSRSRPSLRCR